MKYSTILFYTGLATAVSYFEAQETPLVKRNLELRNSHILVPRQNRIILTEAPLQRRGNRASRPGSSRPLSAISTPASTPFQSARQSLHSSPGSSRNSSPVTSPNSTPASSRSNSPVRGQSPRAGRSASPGPTSPPPTRPGRSPSPGPRPLAGAEDIRPGHRRGDSGSSFSSGSSEEQNNPPVSPTGRARVYGQGPALLSLDRDGNKQQKTIRRGSSGSLHGEYVNYATGTARTDGTHAGPQKLSAEFKGKQVLGVSTPQGDGTGNIITKKVGFPQRNHPVEGTGGENSGMYKSVHSSVPGGAKVIASSDHGGQISGMALPRTTNTYPRS